MRVGFKIIHEGVPKSVVDEILYIFTCNNLFLYIIKMLGKKLIWLGNLIIYFYVFSLIYFY